MKAQGKSLKVGVYLFGGLFILIILTITWLLGDNAFLQPRGVTMTDLQFESWGWRDFFPYFGPFSVTPFQSVSQVIRSKSLKLG